MTEKGVSVLDAEHREEQVKTLKARRRLYVGAFIIVLAALIYLLGQVLNILAVPMGIIVWATIIVFCLKGPVNYLEGKGLPRVWGTTFAYVLLIAVLAAMFWLLFSPVLGLSDQFAALLQSIPDQIAALSAWWESFYPQYQHLLQDEQITTWINDALASVGTWISSLAATSAESVVFIGSGVATSVLVIGFALVVAFWTLMELPALGREVKRLFGPRFQEDLDMIYLTGTRVMGGYIKGTVFQCALIGIVCAIGFTVMGIPSPAAIGLITGLLNIIPVVGPWLGGAMAAGFGIFTSPLIAILAVVYTVVVQQVVYTFISPKVMGDSVDIHPALVILALMMGSALGGAMSGMVGSVVGMLASIPAVAFFKSLFVYYFEKRTGRVIVAQDGVIFKGEPHGSEANPVADATGEFIVPDDLSGQARHRRR